MSKEKQIALKIQIAKLLPERIHYDDCKQFCWLRPIFDGSIVASGELVRDTEWLQIVQDYLKTLHPNQQVDYIRELEQSFRREENKHFGDKPEKKFPFNEFGRFAVATADFNQICAALEAAGIIKV